MKEKNWIKENKNILIGSLIFISIIISIIQFVQKEHFGVWPGEISMANEEVRITSFLSSCQFKCNNLDIYNEISINDFCCESSDLDQDNIFENNGGLGPEICALIYNSCEISCSDYGFNTVEGCGLNG